MEGGKPLSSFKRDTTAPQAAAQIATSLSVTPVGGHYHTLRGRSSSSPDSVPEATVSGLYLPHDSFSGPTPLNGGVALEH